ncbi:hypothetical protein [Spirosoma oryzae]|uniref:hypothetical protein n=1 Tax=Spirosoma oryzae TaxID=1469603 RepID=UPI000D06A8F9|nr:hypothetical protein [Spirosoma oryzae]
MRCLGGVVYRQFIGRRVLPIDVLFRAAHPWVNEQPSDYMLEAEKPLFRQTRLFPGLIPEPRCPRWGGSLIDTLRPVL